MTAVKTIDDPQFNSLISDVYTEGGYHLLGMADQGFRVMSTNKPVNSLADLKARDPYHGKNSYPSCFLGKALGAKPQPPMSFSEVYIGLQQHTIDAQGKTHTRSSFPTISMNSRIML